MEHDDGIECPERRFQNISYQMLKAIIDCVYEGVCIVDVDGNVIIWNRSAEKLYGIPYEEIIGRNITLFFDNAIVDQVRQTGISVENIYHSPKKDSHILASSMPLYFDDILMGAISTDRDFAEVRKLYFELENANTRLLFLENEVKKISGNFGKIVGNNPKFIKKINMARQIAPSNANVIITGESGTGKEIFARGIHELSGRKGLFVPVNCGAIPAELFESEFFGYAPGAFTGAGKKGKLGIFELANGGTIFLDEIGDMPFSMQAKLLRVLQEKEVVKLGGECIIKLDVRVVSATNKDLKKMVEDHQFREDLYYRLNVIELNLPPLRERKDDLPLLIDYFIKEFTKKNSKKISGVHPEVMSILSTYQWPGNIREVMNVVEQMVVVNYNGIIHRNLIPEYITNNIKKGEHTKQYPLDLPTAIQKLEKENIREALRLSRNNKSKAAEFLDIPRASLYHKIKKYKIVPEKC